MRNALGQNPLRRALCMDEATQLEEAVEGRLEERRQKPTI